MEIPLSKKGAYDPGLSDERGTSDAFQLCVSSAAGKEAKYRLGYVVYQDESELVLEHSFILPTLYLSSGHKDVEVNKARVPGWLSW